MEDEYSELLDALTIFKKLRVRILKEVSLQHREMSRTDVSLFSRICKGNGDLTMSDLSDVTAFSHGIITLSVDNLERLGLVERIKGKDRRTYYIAPTGAGKEKYRSIRDTQKRVMDEILRNLTENEHERLLQVLAELRTLLGKYLE